MGLFDKLKGALSKTKDVLRTDVRDLFKAGEILDEEHLEKFHRGLIKTDMGVAAAGEIVDELRNQYLLAFAASTRPGWKPLEIRAKQRNLVVRARSGYVAGGGRTSQEARIEE